MVLQRGRNDMCAIRGLIRAEKQIPRGRRIADNEAGIDRARRFHSQVCSDIDTRWTDDNGAGANATQVRRHGCGLIVEIIELLESVLELWHQVWSQLKLEYGCDFVN